MPFQEKLELVNRAADEAPDSDMVGAWLSSLRSRETSRSQQTTSFCKSQTTVHVLQTTEAEDSMSKLALEGDQVSSSTFKSEGSSSKMKSEDDQMSSSTLLGSECSEIIGNISVAGTPVHDKSPSPAGENGTFRTRNMCIRRSAPQVSSAALPGKTGSFRLKGIYARKTAPSIPLAPCKPMRVPKRTPTKKQARHLSSGVLYHRVAGKSTRGIALRKPTSPTTKPLCPLSLTSSPSTAGRPDPVSQLMRDTHARYKRYLWEREMDVIMGL